MVQLDDGMIAALRQVAKDPTRALRPAGHLPALPHRRYAPATPRQLAESERQLGFRLPVLVRQLYTLVANGDFGPGDGLLGLVGGAVDQWDQTAVDSYLTRRYLAAADPAGQPPWPWGLLPISWGCSSYFCVDCQPGIREGHMVVFDPGCVDVDGDGDWSVAFVGMGRTLPRWLQGWVDGKDLHPPALRYRPLRWPWDWDGEPEQQDDRVVGPAGTCAGQLTLFG